MAEREECVEVDFISGGFCAGGYRLTAVPTEEGFEITNADTGEDELLDKVVIDAESAWRAIATYSLRTSLHCVFELSFKGVSTVESEALDLILGAMNEGDWSQGWGGALASLNDETLLNLSAEIGSFSAPAARSEMVRIWTLLDERDGDSEALASAIESALAFGAPTFAAIEDEVLLWHETNAIEAARAHAKWEARVGPFREDINAILAALRREYPPSSAVTQMVFAMKAADIARFLDQYVFDHGALPKGTHVVPKRGGQFQIDFSDLASDET